MRMIMSKRDRLDPTSAPMSKSETAQTARVLRDDEMDAVGGGISSALGVSQTRVARYDAGKNEVSVESTE